MPLPPFTSTTPTATFNKQGKTRQIHYNVKDYGAVGNVNLVIDGAITSGQATLTSSAASFTAADVGKLVTVRGAGAAGGLLGTSISAYNSSTSVTLAANASTTVTNATVIYGTDDLAAINAAIADATATGGRVFFPSGMKIGITGTITVSPSQSATRSCIVPSLFAYGVPGRIGDGGTSSFLDEIDTVAFYPLTGFPAGKFMLDYVSQSNTMSLNGAHISGLGFICNTVAAGVRISNTRRFLVENMGIDHPATPSGYSDGSATAGFNALQQGGTSTAYNRYCNITVSYSAKDGFSHSAAGDDVFDTCYDLNATRYAYFCQGFGRFINCHYEQSGQGWYVLGGQKQNMIIGADIFGVPTGNAVQLTTNGTSFPVQFISCNFQNIPSGTPTEENGSVIAIQNNNQKVIANFMGCTFNTNTHTTDWVYVESAVVAGSKVKFIGCDFLGTPATKKFNDASGKNVLVFRGCDGVPDTAYNNARTAVSDANYTVLMSDSIVATKSLTAPRTLTVPDATLFTGMLTIKDEDGSVTGTNTITIATTSAQTIDGSSTAVISVPYTSLTMYSNGTNWSVI